MTTAVGNTSSIDDDGRPPPPPVEVEINDDHHDDPYARSPVTTCPPLVRLQYYGLCCPFFEAENDHRARIGHSCLQDRPICWYRKKRLGGEKETEKEKEEKNARGCSGRAASPSSSSSSSSSGGGGGCGVTARGLIDGLGRMFGGGGGGGGEKWGATRRHEPTTMTYVGVLATLSVVDTDAHGPAIQIRALDDDDDDNDNDRAKGGGLREYVATGRPWWEDLRDGRVSAMIPLYAVESVSSGWALTGGAWNNAGGVVRVYAKKNANQSSSSPSVGEWMTGGGGMGRELLRFDPLSRGRGDFETNEDVDDVIVQLRSLVDWNRRRMAKDVVDGRAIVVPKSASAGYVVMS